MQVCTVNVNNWQELILNEETKDRFFKSIQRGRGKTNWNFGEVQSTFYFNLQASAFYKTQVPVYYAPVQHFVRLIIPAGEFSDGIYESAVIDDPYVLDFLNSLATTNGVTNYGRLAPQK